MKEKEIITFFLINFKRGGTEWVITNLANEFFRQGFEVHILSVKEGTMERELIDSVQFKHFNKNYFKAIRACYKHLRKKKSKMLITSQHGASALSYLVGKIANYEGTRVVREPDSNFKYYHRQHKILIRGILKYLLQKSYQNASAVIVHTLATEKSLLKSNIIKPNAKNIVQIPNPIEIHKIKSKALETSVLNSVDLPKGEFIVSIGRLIDHKNIDKIIETLPLLSKQLELVIVGVGPEEMKLKRLVKQLGLNQRVFFTGHLDNPYPVLKKAKALITIGEWEGFGMVVLEALCLKVPTVSLDNDQGPAIIIDNGKYGFLSPDLSLKNLSIQIENALGCRISNEKLFSRSENFDTFLIAKEYLKLINK